MHSRRSRHPAPILRAFRFIREGWSWEDLRRLAHNAVFHPGCATRRPSPGARGRHRASGAASPRSPRAGTERARGWILVELQEIHDQRLPIGGVDPVLVFLHQQARAHVHARDLDFEGRDQARDLGIVVHDAVRAATTASAWIGHSSARGGATVCDATWVIPAASNSRGSYA